MKPAPGARAFQSRLRLNLPAAAQKMWIDRILEMQENRRRNENFMHLHQIARRGPALAARRGGISHGVRKRIKGKF
jgi:hypothetical protein